MNVEFSSRWGGAILALFALFALVTLAPLWGVGCIASTEPPAPGDDVGTIPPLAIEFEILPSASIATAAVVTGVIDADSCDVAQVQFGTDGLLEQSREATCDHGDLHATLVLLETDTEYEVRISLVVDGVEHRSDVQSFVTGSAPVSLPGMHVTTSTGSDGRPGYLVTSVIKGDPMALVLDRDGDLVWWHEPDEPDGMVVRAVLSRDGASVLYLLEQPFGDGEVVGSKLVRVGLDGLEVDRQGLQGVHHDFVELPDGTIALLARDARELDGVETVGDAIVELLPGGDLLQVWSVWDDFEPDPDWADGMEDTALGWSHANALDYDEATDSYVVGLCALNAIVAVSRDTGEPSWQLGGTDSDYALADGGTELFEQQHQFQLLGGGIVVFDNGRAEEGYESRAVEYRLDVMTGEADEVWQHRASPPLYCPVLGDVNRLADGTTLVTWSTAGLLEEVSDSGEVVWSLGLELGAGLGYTTVVDELPTP